MRISYLSSDVCSSDLRSDILLFGEDIVVSLPRHHDQTGDLRLGLVERGQNVLPQQLTGVHRGKAGYELVHHLSPVRADPGSSRSEEHTSELQSLMRISYAVFCLKKKKKRKKIIKYNDTRSTTHAKKKKNEKKRTQINRQH